MKCIHNNTTLNSYRGFDVMRNAAGALYHKVYRMKVFCIAYSSTASFNGSDAV